MGRTIPKRTVQKALTVLLIVFLILLLAGLGYYRFFRIGQQSPTPKTNITTTQSGAYVNQTPATPEEKQDAQNTKGTPTPTPTPSNSGKQAVTVVITSADPTNVRAYVQGVIEDGGICTAAFTSGSTVKTGTTTGISNVSYTVCPAIQVAGVEKGTWTLTYSYESKSYSGSANKNVQL